MEHQEVRERLNDYADDVLSERDRRAVDEHLESCPECRDELAALRTLLDAAAGLPRSLEPERDLWPGVRSRLEPAAAPRPAGRPGWMRFLSGWQPLAAAAALAVVVAAVLLITTRTPRQATETPPQTATGPAGESGESVPFTVLDNEGKKQSATVARMIWALEAESMGAGKALVATLQTKPEALSTEELEAIDTGLRTLDQAISESATALRADPENPMLVRQVTGYYRQRLSILRRATEIALHA